MKSIIAIGIILIGFLTSCDAQKTNNSEANGVITKDVTPAEFKELINSNEAQYMLCNVSYIQLNDLHLFL